MSAPGGTVPPNRGEGWPPPNAGRPPSGPRTPARGGGDSSMAPGVTLTGAGAVVLMIVLAALGAMIDILLGPALGTATTITLAVGSVAAAWLVRRRDVFPVVVAPPLVYLLLAVVTALGASDVGVTLAGLAAALVYGFPAMAIATTLVVVVVSARHVAGR